MRGKMRDKRVTDQNTTFNHEERHEDVERRRPYKRDSRTMLWNNPVADEDENELDEVGDEGEEQEPQARLPEKK